MDAALAIDRRRVLADGQERHLPALLGAVGEELVEDLAGVVGRPDRIGGDHRVAADVGVGDQRLPVGGEEVALVAAQGEVGERVGAVGADDPPRSLARVLPGRRGCGRAAGRRGTSSVISPTMPRTSSASEKKSAEEVVLEGVGTVEADQAAVGRLDHPPERQVGADEVALGEQRDEAEDADDERGRRGRTGPPGGATPRRRGRGTRSGYDASATSIADVEQGRDRVRPLDQVDDGGEREQRHRDRPGPALAASELQRHRDQADPEDRGDDEQVGAVGSREQLVDARARRGPRAASAAARRARSTPSARRGRESRRERPRGRAPARRRLDRRAASERGRPRRRRGRSPSPARRRRAPSSGRRVGKRMTSRIVSTPASSITSRSMPIPSPPVGGSPYSSAST